MADDFDDADDTDELPSTSQVFRVPDDSPAAPGAGRPDPSASDRAATTPLPARDPAPTAPTTPADDGPVGPATRPARFGASRRRALLWDAGWCLVTGVVLLVMAAADRPVDLGPPWATVAAGVVGIGWAAVLAGAAAGGVSRATTTLVGLANLGVGVGGFVLGWARTDVPTLLLVLAAQVAGFGLLQVVASVRR